MNTVVRASELAKLTQRGRYRVDERIYLQVSPSGVRSWIFRYRAGGLERQKGLGPLRHVPIAEAKRRAAALSKELVKGSDPLTKDSERRAEKPVPTFAEACQAWYSGKRWRSEKHSHQVAGSLRAYALPRLGDMPVDQITMHDVVDAISPIWCTKPETASRVLTRIAAVLRRAKALGHCRGDNPADWGVLQHALPDRPKVVTHHAALPWPGESPGLFQALLERPGEAARALAFTILTAARSGEVLGARWSELDLEAKLWTIPAERMKSGREHRVPLSPEALVVLAEQHVFAAGPKLFPRLGVNSLSNELRRSRPGVSVHGFRSSFRDWAGDATAHPREVAEAALAHAIGDRTEAAYRRGSALEKRRILMAAWGAFLVAPAAEIVPIQSRRA